MYGLKRLDQPIVHVLDQNANFNDYQTMLKASNLIQSCASNSDETRSGCKTPDNLNVVGNLTPESSAIAQASVSLEHVDEIEVPESPMDENKRIALLRIFRSKKTIRSNLNHFAARIVRRNEKASHNAGPDSFLSDENVSALNTKRKRTQRFEKTTAVYFRDG